MYDINGNAAGLCCFDLFLEISAFPTFLCQYGIWKKLVQQLLLFFSLMDKNNQLETAPIGKLVFKLAIPTVMAQLVNLLYNIVDRIYVGRIPEIGSLSLAGLGV